MRNPNPSERPMPASGYAPSVPISVYRELSAELQATKTLLDSLNNQNQQLTQQNQQLRQELERVVQAALNSRQVADSLKLPGWGNPAPAHAHPPTHPEVQSESARPVTRTQRTGRSVAQSEPKSAKRPLEPSISDKLFTEQPAVSPRSQRQETTAKEMGGFWLTLLITAIVITAFGAGFMVVRPLLSPNR